MEPPIKPDESDCCNSGCNPCILDVYEEQLKKYKQKILGSIKPNGNCISPTSYSVFKLVNVEPQSEVAFLYTFEYLQPLKGKRKESNLALCYEPGQHFLMKARVDDEDFTRAYTPIPVEDTMSLHFTTLIKLYKHGKMSNYLRKIPLDCETLWRGPYGGYKINYNIKFLFLIAQGSGIAPLYSIIYNIVNNEDNCTFLKLFFSCSDCSNIYLRDQLYSLTSYWNFTYDVFLGKEETVSIRYNETIHLKKLDFTDISNYLLGKQDSVNVLICGTEGFIGSVKKHVLNCKVKENDVFSF